MDLITITDHNGQTIKIPRSSAKQSLIISSMLSQKGIPIITKFTLSEVENVFNYLQIPDITVETLTEEFDRQDLDYHQIFRLIEITEYLDVPILFDLILVILANLLRQNNYIQAYKNNHPDLLNFIINIILKFPALARQIAFRITYGHIAKKVF